MTDENEPEEIEAVETEDKDEYKNKYLRLLADMENTRKRLQREKEENGRFAIESMITDLLTPLDNLENALKFAHLGSEETRNWALGFQMIVDQFKEVLHHYDVTPFHSEGKLFDPHEHEAVEMEENDTVPPNTILQEFVKGYKTKKRIIRPAKVKVSKNKS